MQPTKYASSGDLAPYLQSISCSEWDGPGVGDTMRERGVTGFRPHPSPQIGGAGRLSQSAGGDGSAGLVHSQTTGNCLSRGHEQIHVDPVASRLRRMKHGTITAARLASEAVSFGGFRGRWAFLTATYADPDGWAACHISELLGHVRKWLARRGHRFVYVWVAEIQPGRLRRTGDAVIHYHLLLWLPKGLTLPKPDKQGWWAHGMTKVEWARNPVGYMAKYSSKADGPCRFPKGARIHGCGGLQGDQAKEARYWRRPTWLREQTRVHDDVRRKVGGGWIDTSTGELYESPWEVFFEGGGVWIRKRRPGVGLVPKWGYPQNGGTPESGASEAQG